MAIRYRRKDTRFSGLVLLVGVIWLVALAQVALGLDLSGYGIRPRQLGSLPGILSWSFVHGNWQHLMGNTSMLLALGGIISARTSSRLFLSLSAFVAIGAGLGVWIFARQATHIGASGLVFGYFGYIVARGIFDRSLMSVVVAALVILFFGGMVWGVLPTDKPVSWEGHFFGLAAGYLFARYSKDRGYSSRRP